MIQLANAEIRKVETTADKSIKITLITPELPPEQMAALFMAQKEGVETVEFPEMVEDNGKSPAVRLRGVLYRVWEQKGEGGDFETYYRKIMEQLIEKYKEKLT